MNDQVAEPPQSSAESRFSEFFAEAEPRLRRAVGGSMPPDAAADAVADALAWGWANWERLEPMEHPVGYLYRVARSHHRTRAPKRVRWLVPDTQRLPDIEPGLVDALQNLSDQQRRAVWLVHACQWTHSEVAEALDITTSAASTHVARGMEKLRNAIGGNHD